MFHVKQGLRSRGILMFHVEPTQGLTPKPVSDVSRETETHFFLTTDTTRVDSPSSTPRSSCTSHVAALNLRRAFNATASPSPVRCAFNSNSRPSGTTSGRH